FYVRLSLFYYISRRPPGPPLFPYTTLFRSDAERSVGSAVRGPCQELARTDRAALRRDRCARRRRRTASSRSLTPHVPAARYPRGRAAKTPQAARVHHDRAA